MITLCMDTSHIYLSLALIRDDEIIGEVQEECWKHQSEEIFPKLEEMLSKLSLKSDDIDQIVITKGPGSYTGVRIIIYEYYMHRMTLNTLAQPNAHFLLSATHSLIIRSYLPYLGSMFLFQIIDHPQ